MMSVDRDRKKGRRNVRGEREAEWENEEEIEIGDKEKGNPTITAV